MDVSHCDTISSEESGYYSELYTTPTDVKVTRSQVSRRTIVSKGNQAVVIATTSIVSVTGRSYVDSSNSTSDCQLASCRRCDVAETLMCSVNIGEFSVQNVMREDPETCNSECNNSECDTELALTCEYPRKPPVNPERETCACKSVQAIGAGTFEEDCCRVIPLFRHTSHKRC